MVKGSMQQELTILNIYAPNTRAPRYIKQIIKNLQKDLDSHTIIVRDFNTALSTLNRLTRHKINKNIQDLNSDLDKANLIDIYSRTLHPKSTEYTSSQHISLTHQQMQKNGNHNKMHSSANAKEWKS